MRRPHGSRRGLRWPSGGRRDTGHSRSGATSRRRDDPIYADALRLAAGRCRP